MAWIAIRVDVSEALVDAVASHLLDAGAAGVVTAASDEASPPPPGQARLEAHFPVAQASAVVEGLQRYLAGVATFDPVAGAARVYTAALPPLDWNAQFRLHHRPIAVGTRLLVAPPWDVPPTTRDVLVIEPGMAFGTGQHATTRACLENIEAIVDGGGIEAALDVGTGSGILAAALVALGVPRVVAIDADPSVLGLARANLTRNGAARTLLVGARPAALRARFDLVVANLRADTLVDEAGALAGLVAPAGHLVVAGLLDTQVGAVTAAYPGFTTVTERREDAWRTLHLVRAR